MNKNEFTTIDTQYANEQEHQGISSIFASRKNFMEWFRSFFDRSLVIYQLFYFSYYAAFGSLFPLISIYFKQLGLNALQCGILSGTRSLVECFAAPFWTALADKWKKGKMFVLVSLFFAMAFTLGLGFVRPTPEGCLVSLPRSTRYNATASDDEDGLILSIIQPYKASRYDDVKSVDMDRDLALKIRNQLGQSPLYLNTKLLVSPPKMKATRWGTGVGQQTGDQNLYARTQAYHDPTQFPPGSLVMPLYSTVVYGQTKINQIFIVILLLVLFSEIMSCAAIPIVDAAVLQQSGIDFCNNYEKQRIFGSIGWALSMFFIGLILDHSTSFPDYPCLHPGYREKNYMVCFATYSVFIAFALFIATQFTFQYEGDSESMYFKLVKDKMARTFLGRTTKSRSKLVNEDDEEDVGAKDWKPDPLLHEIETGKVTSNEKSKHSNEEILEQQLGIKIVQKNDGVKLKSQNTMDAQQEELAAAAQLKVSKLMVIMFITCMSLLKIRQRIIELLRNNKSVIPFYHCTSRNLSPTYHL